MAKLLDKRFWQIAAVVVFTSILVGLFIWSRPISGEEANRSCQEFFDQVQTEISMVDGFSILESQKSCKPQEDEAGNTDYYFDANFRVSKAGIESAEGIKAAIKNFDELFPATDYPIWISNDAAINGRPDTLCIVAGVQIQENGQTYNPSEPKHYADYTEPGSLPEYEPCDGLQKSL